MSEPSERPPIASSPISVILFAHALSTETSEVLAAWKSYLVKLNRAYEIIVVQETRPEVTPVEAPTDARVIPYERAVGFCAAVTDAIATAQHPLIAFCACDHQYRPADMEHLLKLIDQVDLVVGYRAGGQAPLWRVLLDTFSGMFSRVILGIPLGSRVCWLGSEGWGRRWISRWAFGVRVQDPECPFRLARRMIFERMSIQSGGPFLQVEVLAKANHMTCLLAEEAVTWTKPALPASDAITFAQDAWLVFRNPEFGQRPTIQPVVGPSPSPVPPVSES